jgi:hypothetical protein
LSQNLKFLQYKDSLANDEETVQLSPFAHSRR